MQTAATQQYSHHSLPEILQELQAESTDLHKEALEKLALYFVQQLGLEFKVWRERGNTLEKTAVNEIAESTNPVFRRWHIYCKNLPDSPIIEDDIAIEVGLSMQSKSDVICIVTTGRFSRDALSYTDSITSETNLSIITIDREDLQILATSPKTIVDILEKKARRTMKLRKAIAS